ncbi:MAG: hypothetical protein FWF54_04915 [Candidatus Azobacteroides sp.]|nr:hypothetical protein [Candidatus Azobacteroides sp.]
MKYALIDSQRKEAERGAKGTCPFCSKPVIAKCGNIKINHWAHKSNSKCDSWSETETEWHRSWKNNYPTEWQEVILHDEETNEKHIADVRTNNNLIIEFQHSSIEHNERIAREKFYKNMVWIVDGTRLTRDYPRFKKGFNFTSRYKGKKDIFLIYSPNRIFPSSWLESTVPVIFDFKGQADTSDNDEERESIYCLFPLRIDYFGAIFTKLTRSSFVATTKNGIWSSRIEDFLKSEPDFVLNEHRIIEKIPVKQKRNKFDKDTECEQFSQNQNQQVIQQPVVYRPRRIILSPRNYGYRRGTQINYVKKKQFSKNYKPRKRR